MVHQRPPRSGRLLNFWRFDDTNYTSLRGHIPKASYGPQITPSWNSNAVRIVGTGPALLEYRSLETDGITNVQCFNGSMWFWFRPLWTSAGLGGTGPGGFGRLVELGHWSADAGYGWWSVYCDTA